MFINNSETKELLSKLCDPFSHIAVDCVESLFQQQWSICEGGWGIKERLDGEFENIFSVGSANDTHQAIMSIGLSDQTLNSFLGENFEMKDAADALGEFCNQFSGMVHDIEDFKSHFGILMQSVPVYSRASCYFPRVWAICGTIHCDGNEMYVGYAVRALPKLS